MSPRGGATRANVDNPFSMHYQKVWEERAGDRRLPDWFRAAAIAYGKHRANGHANFKQGDLRWVLGSVNEETGEIRPSLNVSRAIRTAVGFGLLASGSNSRCLIVPHHAIEGGLGSRHEQCRASHP